MGTNKRLTAETAKFSRRPQSLYTNCSSFHYGFCGKFKLLINSALQFSWMKVISDQ